MASLTNKIIKVSDTCLYWNTQVWLFFCSKHNYLALKYQFCVFNLNFVYGFSLRFFS